MDAVCANLHAANPDIRSVKLSTPVSFQYDGPRIAYGGAYATMGSCFSANVGAWMKSLQLQVEVNPSGIIYNPISIAQHIHWALSENEPDAMLRECSAEQSAGQWVHTGFHSSLNADSAEAAHSNIEERLARLQSALLHSKVLFITFGSAIVYACVESGRVVNNCHRLPSARFRKRMATQAEMYEAMVGAIEALQRANPDAHVCLTVSPVRHLRHGAVDNMRSKAGLLGLCGALEQRFDRLHYLPVYEFVMDELRDYRFYRHDDLIHLNEAGLTLLQERLLEEVFDTSALALVALVERWRLMEQHRVQLPESKQARNFEMQKSELRKHIEARLGYTPVF